MTKLLLDNLRALQFAIYEIDDLLEQTWDIDAKVGEFITEKRTEIELLVMTITESKDRTKELLKRLRTFFQMELQMRE